MSYIFRELNSKLKAIFGHTPANEARAFCSDASTRYQHAEKVCWLFWDRSAVPKNETTSIHFPEIRQITLPQQSLPN